MLHLVNLIFVGCVVIGVTHTPLAAVVTQDAEGQEAESLPSEFFSGSVQDLSETSVSVTRSLAGKTPETRMFQLSNDTIVEGHLKKQARVTVGFRTHDGQDHAWRIIVRENPE